MVYFCTSSSRTPKLAKVTPPFDTFCPRTPHVIEACLVRCLLHSSEETMETPQGPLGVTGPQFKIYGSAASLSLQGGVTNAYHPGAVSLHCNALVTA